MADELGRQSRGYILSTQPAFRWITASSKPGVTYEEMADTSDGGSISFATLDAKLGSALTGVAPSDFLRQVQVKKAEALIQAPWLLEAKSSGSWTVTLE